ncbi:hypothetical protein SLEP1_g35084 [Rubroshorea leprosula]|uniref:Uncharacterized protein n=1 Tax=Rubroshorea leprosula TaxID=152421 RepID=A0AAV5KME2_9ROSI|nr:hypothetical protein SLEP1_g35084 [Rubroshorea leprosula]
MTFKEILQTEVQIDPKRANLPFSAKPHPDLVSPSPLLVRLPTNRPQFSDSLTSGKAQPSPSFAFPEERAMLVGRGMGQLCAVRPTVNKTGEQSKGLKEERISNLRKS